MTVFDHNNNDGYLRLCQLPACLTVCLPDSAFLSVFHSTCLCVHLPTCLPVCLSVQLAVSGRMCVSIAISLSLSLSLSLSFSHFFSQEAANKRTYMWRRKQKIEEGATTKLGRLNADFLFKRSWQIR